MKTIITAFLGLLCLTCSNRIYSQQSTLDSLFQATIKKQDQAGWLWFYPNTMQIGQIFTKLYACSIS